MALASEPDRWVALCLHDVLPSTDASGGGPERFATPLSAFELMLETLRENGYAGLSLAECMVTAGRRRVAITFDDATRSQYDFAAPALRRRGMTATVYVVTDWVGRPGYMTWDELRQLADWGFSLQSHSKSHPFLSELTRERLREELELSKAALDDALQQNTQEIAFPGGDAPRRAFVGMLTDAGYRVAVGTRWGANSPAVPPSSFLRRCTVRGNVTQEWTSRVATGDGLMGMSAAFRESVLRGVRRSLGPSRYAAIRRSLLDAISSVRSEG